MRFSRALSLSATAATVASTVLPRQNLPSNATAAPYSLPNTRNAQARSAQITTIRSGFEYGPDIIEGEGVYWPKGPYADQMINFDQTTFFAEQLPWVGRCEADAAAAAQAVAQSGGLASLEDWFKFYEMGFKNTVPTGPYPGMLSNGTSDLLFSMERLSTAPFGVRRLAAGTLMSFQTDDAIARNLTTMTQAELLDAGRLFYVDYRDQLNMTVTAGRYAGAAEAFFFLHPETDQFLPLSIRLNRGSSLVYTPTDDADDWLFAKLAFNMNDLWYQQWYHLETTHVLVDIVFEAAVRSLSPDHPIYAIMDRLAYQTFAFRISTIKTLLNKGGPVDELFFASGSDAGSYAAHLYHDAGAGDWLKTDFLTDLSLRGLIGSGPPLPHYPFFEDGIVILGAISEFMTAYVTSYYADDQAVESDPELASFVKEAVPAGIIDFPTSICSRSELVSLLTHFAMQASVIHAATNGNTPVKSTASLPYHPMAFYQPLPSTKGLSNLVPFMPNLTQSAGQITLLAAFNRPFISETNPTGANRTLAEMFDLPDFLARANAETRQANTLFKTQMSAFSQVVQARAFDEDGLSQGMPFIWTSLDPLNTPFYLTV
ncbi:hypothetical protein ANO11243_027170 [Dothideomycetidae sp. 11243]|nr:hypothetical protein ANO11243_027170 [fungal sp. No.11243]